jgi:hypothetical protein
VRRARSPRAEIWVWGNPRPVICLAIAGLLLAAALAAALVTVGGAMLPSRGVAVGSAAAVMIVALAAAGLLLFGGLQPRLARRGGALVVRLQPLVAHEVPLEVVECVFPGSQPLPPRSHEPDADPDRRVGTIVIRLAERATAWRQRPTFSPWGTWEDGHIIIDGRWCQRLSPEFARGLGGRLVEAKRETHDAMVNTVMSNTVMTERSA